MAPFIAAIFFIICVLLIVVVLLQKGRGGGLSAALGGMGSSAFGTRVGDVFTWVTIVLVSLFLLLSILVKVAYQPELKPLPAPLFIPAATEGQEIPAKGMMVTIKQETEKIEYYYTTDGSEPTKDNGTRYEGAIRVMPPFTVLKARAYSVSALESPIATELYGINPDAATQPAAAQPEE